MKKFTLENLKIWELKRDVKFGGYKLPVSFKDAPTTIEKIEKIAEKQDAKSPFYGESKTIYFKLFELTKKQKEDLLDQGRQQIDISFTIEDTPYSSEYKGKKVKYLRLKVIGLKKRLETGDEAPSDEV